MKMKARATLREARLLADHGYWAGAANRAYYALYQALVARCRRRGLRPADFGHFDARDPDRWPHWIFRRHAAAAGLNRRTAALVLDAWAYRVRADYEPDPLPPMRVEGILTRVSSALAALERPR